MVSIWFNEFTCNDESISKMTWHCYFKIRVPRWTCSRCMYKKNKSKGMNFELKVDIASNDS